MNKRLALYMVQFGGGGVEKLFETLARELSLHFKKIDIVVCNGSNPNLNISDKQNVRIYNLNCCKGYGEMYAALSLFKLRRYLKKYRPDILISCPGYSCIISILARRFCSADTKIVNIIDNKISLLKKKRWYHKVLFLLLKRLLKDSDSIVVPYDKAKDDIADNISIDPEKISIIPHPIVNESLFEKAEKKINNSIFANEKIVPHFLYVGRLSEEKGILILLEAFEEVNKTLDLKLFIVGDGPQREEIEKWIAAHRLKNKIVLLGYQSNPYPYFKQCNLLVLPSKTEAFGIVIVEALALGCPVVSTNTQSGGPASILCDGKYGMLSKANDADSLKDAMLSCYSNKWNKDVLRQRGLEYSIESNIKKYIKLLRQ